MANKKTLQTLIQFRRGYQAQWNAVANTYIPKAGEPCATLDGKNKGQVKIGDGTSTWGELKYVGVNEGAIHFIGTVAEKNNLPESAETGDIYQVTAERSLYIWDGDSWEIFHAVDLSNYYNKEETDNLIKVSIKDLTTNLNKKFDGIDSSIGEINQKISDTDNKITEVGQKVEDVKTEIAKNYVKKVELDKYALKTDLDVIKVYGETADDTSVEVNGQTFIGVNEAIDAVEDGGTIKLSSGLEADEPISANKRFTVDMNNAVIVNNDTCPVVIKNTGDLTLTGNGNVECNKNGRAVIESNGNVTIKNGTYSRSIDEKGNGGYVLKNHGYMTINDGIFSSPGGLSSLVDNGYYNYSKEHVDGENAESPELTINGGTFINAYTTIKNDDSGILTINDGKFYGMIYNVGKIVTINGGYFSTNDGYATIQSIKSNDTLNIGKTIITGGTFEGTGKELFTIEGNAEFIVSGGRFSHQLPEAMIADGYEQDYIDGYYVVTAKI